MKMLAAPSASRLNSPFVYCPLKLSSPSSFSSKSLKTQRSPVSYPCVRAVDLDQNTIVAITVGVVSVAVGIGIPVFYETQIDSAAKRDNTQPCFPCNGSGARCKCDANKYSLRLSKDEAFLECEVYNNEMSRLRWDGGSELYMLLSSNAGEKCRFCTGSGSVTVDLGGEAKEVSQCINCDGAGSLTCTTCQGSGIQPRYLDRREFKDDD